MLRGNSLLNRGDLLRIGFSERVNKSLDIVNFFVALVWGLSQVRDLQANILESLVTLLSIGFQITLKFGVKVSERIYWDTMILSWRINGLDLRPDVGNWDLVWLDIIAKGLIKVVDLISISRNPDWLIFSILLNLFKTSLYASVLLTKLVDFSILSLVVLAHAAV